MIKFYALYVCLLVEVTEVNIIINRIAVVKQGDNALGSVHLSVRLFV